MKFSHILERSPRDWETTMLQNVVLAFSTHKICHGAWKIIRTTICCFLFLQSRGEVLKSKENYGTKFSLPFKPSPQDWRKMNQQSVVLRMFHASWHIFCAWKNARTTCWCIVVSQSRGDRSKTWENFMDSGSQSETYKRRKKSGIKKMCKGGRNR